MKVNNDEYKKLNVSDIAEILETRPNERNYWTLYAFNLDPWIKRINLNMKYLAHIKNDLTSDIISVYDVYKGLNSKNPVIWESREYYSLWHLTPMYARVNYKKKAPHFAFKNGFGGNENSGGGESIEHQLSKKVIYDNKVLHLKIGDLVDKLIFSEVIIEKEFENGKYKADLYVKIANENKFDFPIGSNLIIELHKTNKVKKSKQQFYRNNNIAAIEIEIWDKIKYEENIDKLQCELHRYFSKRLFTKTLHDPNYIKHKIERTKREQESKSVVKVQLPKENIIPSKSAIIETNFHKETVYKNKVSLVEPTKEIKEKRFLIGFWKRLMKPSNR